MDLRPSFFNFYNFHVVRIVQKKGGSLYRTSQSTIASAVRSLKNKESSIGGSVVECSPATRAARVRFPADAHFARL